MVAIHIASTALINPPGVTPVLSQAQAWAGLVRKAHAPQEFVPVVESCEIHSATDEEVACTVHFKGDNAVAHARTVYEVCTLHAPCRLDYKIDGGSRATNVISTGRGQSDEGDELFLTFIFKWEHPKLAAGSDGASEAERHHRKVTEFTVLP